VGRSPDLDPQPRRGGRTRAWDGDDLPELDIEPYQQGELDSLCGIYAIINAVHALCPEMDGELAETLFGKLVRSLSHHVERPISPLYDGLSQEALQALLAVAAREIRRELDVCLNIKPYPAAPTRPTLAAFWEELRRRLKRKHVAILGLSGAEEHWTVAYAISDKLIRLLDSENRKVLRRSRCTTYRGKTRVLLDPSAVILVKRGR
jgi:hypothetical protein